MKSYSGESIRTSRRTRKVKSVMKILIGFEHLLFRVRDLYRQCDCSKKKERREKLMTVSHLRKRKSSQKLRS